MKITHEIANQLHSYIKTCFAESNSDFTMDTETKNYTFCKLLIQYYDNEFIADGSIDVELLTGTDSDKEFTNNVFRVLRRLRVQQVIEQIGFYKRDVGGTVTEMQRLIAEHNLETLPSYLKLGANSDLPLMLQKLHCANFPAPYNVSKCPSVNLPENVITAFQGWPVGGGHNPQMNDFMSTTDVMSSTIQGHIEISTWGLFPSPIYSWPGNIGDMIGTHMFANSCHSKIMSLNVPHAKWLYLELHQYQFDGLPLRMPQEPRLDQNPILDCTDFAIKFNNYLLNADLQHTIDLTHKVNFVLQKWDAIATL